MVVRTFHQSSGEVQKNYFLNFFLCKNYIFEERLDIITFERSDIQCLITLFALLTLKKKQ